MIIIKSDIVSLHGAAISKIGGRPENQDDMAYLDTPLGFLIVVCDGMGGGPGGKTASYIVKQEIAEVLLNCSPQTPRDLALKKAAARAHQSLEEKMRENPALCGMGATFVAALINSQSAVIAHAGDSRLYRLHGKKCLFRTRDHSLVAELVKKKVMTEEDARLSPQANVITRGLGSTNNHVPEIDEIPFKKGDRFVLCTDGIWGSMQQPELLKIFTRPNDLQQLLTELSDQVDKIGFSKGGSHDNHTIAMFEFGNDSQLKDTLSLNKKISIAAGVLFFLVMAAVLYSIVIAWQKKNASDNFQYDSQPISIGNEVYADKTVQTDEEFLKNKSEETTSDKAGGGDDSDLNKNTARKEIDAIVSNEYANEHVPMETTKDIPHEIIDYLSDAKNVKNKNVKEAQKQMKIIQDKVLQLTKQLAEQTVNDRILNCIEEFYKNIKNEKLWWINGVENAQGYFCTLYPKKFDQYSEEMANIIELLEKESEK